MPLHAAVRSGHVDMLRLLLCHPTRGDPTVTPDPPATLALPAALLNQANNDGWTAAHMAAALGLKVRKSHQNMRSRKLPSHSSNGEDLN